MIIEQLTTAQFQKTIWDHYRNHRREMPWRRARDARDPYRVLVSEIMLQQTQVSRVVTFYKNFITQFPNFKTLARAKTSEVLRAWQGLGYNRRALALQRLAKEVVEKYNGRLPRDREALIDLPGIGPYTAGAIRAFAFNEPEVFIETNIRRVFIHFFFSATKLVTDTELVRYISATLDRKNPREWYYALMDYGAMLGESARAGKLGDRNGAPSGNPNRRSAHYSRQSAFLGSDREIRGKILRELLKRKKISIISLNKELDEPQNRISKIVAALTNEGFISIRKGFLMLL